MTQPDLQNNDAERAVLGACLADKRAFALVAGFLKATDFFWLRHSYIYQAMKRLESRNEPIDILTLQSELSAYNQLDEIGGMNYLTQLPGIAPSEHVETHAKLIQHLAVRRTMLKKSDEMKALAYDEKLMTDELVAEWEAAGMALRDGQRQRRKPLAEMVDEYFDNVAYLMDKRREDPNIMIGVPSGYRDLDHLLMGFQKDDLIIVAGRPGMGKTALLNSMTVNMARNGVRVGILSLEMGYEQLMGRFFAMDTGISSMKLKSAKMSQQEYSRFVTSAGRLSKWGDRIFIDDTAGSKVTPPFVRGTAIEWMHDYGLDVLMLDYLQLASGGSAFRGKDNRVQEVGYIANSLKDLARELHIPVIAAAQLSRAVEQRQDKRPILSDLRESGDIEQSADVVMFLYRDAYYNDDTEFPNQTDIIVSKHRNGPTGTLSLYFERTLTKFIDGGTRTVDLGDYHAT